MKGHFYQNVFVAVVSVLIIAPYLAHAAKEGGGAAVLVCTDEFGKKTGKLLDLYLAEKNKQLEVKYDNVTDVEVQLNKALKKLVNMHFIAEAFDLREQRLRMKLKWLSSDEKSHQRPDLGDEQFSYPNNCTVEWLAYYEDKSKELTIVTQFYDILSKTDQAAFFLHEPLYRIARENLKGKTSEGIRDIVGRLFAESTDTYVVTNLFQTHIFTYTRASPAKVLVHGYPTRFRVEPLWRISSSKDRKHAIEDARMYCIFEDPETKEIKKSLMPSSMVGGWIEFASPVPCIQVWLDEVFNFFHDRRYYGAMETDRGYVRYVDTHMKFYPVLSDEFYTPEKGSESF